VKKAVPILIALGLFLFPCSGIQAKTNPSLEELAAQLTTPELLEKYMTSRFTYVTDQALFGKDEYWQTPREMAARCEGDCEDYALFAQAILKANGYNAFLVSVYWHRGAHTVTVFDNKGKWGIFNLARLVYTNAVTMKDLANFIVGDWSSVALTRQEGATGVISRKFQGNLADRSLISAVLTPPIH